MVPDPDRLDTCITCAPGKFYDILRDNCRTATVGVVPFLDCSYDDICLNCKEHANKYCSECSVINGNL